MKTKLFFFLVTVFTFLNIGLGSWGLTESSEARYAEIGREMLLNKDYINPTLLGIYHYHKPPITYWITTVGYKIFGINEFGARFFLQIAIILQLLLVYKIAQLLFAHRKISFLSVLVYFSFPIVLISSRNLTTDAYLTTFIMAAVYFWLARIKKANGIWSLYAFYIFLGLAILTKGPVALLFVLTFIITYHILLKIPVRTSIHGVLGLILFLAISLSWFMVLLLNNPVFLNYFLGNQLADRMFSNSFDRAKPFYYFIILLPALLFPWLFLLFGKTKKRLQDFFKRKDETVVLTLSALILILLFSLFKTKLILYILPIFWMLAIVVAKKLITARPTMLKIFNKTYAVMCLLLVIASLLFYFTDILKVNISAWQVLITFGLAAIWFGVYFKINDSRILKTGILAVGFNMLLLISGMFFMKNNSAEINSIRDVSKFIENIDSSPDKSVLVFNYLLNSAPFYINGNIVTINAGHDTTQRNTQFQTDDNWKKNLINWEGTAQIPYLTSLVNNPKSILMVRKKDMDSEKAHSLQHNYKKRKEFEKWIVYYN